MTTQSYFTQRRLAALVSSILGAGAAVLSSNAQITLTDGAASVNIDPASQAGVYNWEVGGQDHLAQQWLWYRVGNTAESSIDTLALSGTTLTGTKQVQLDYSGAGFDLELTYSLLGGSFESGVSDLAEQLTIVNTSGGDLDFHLFLYADFDLKGTAAGDTVTSVNYSPFPFSAPGYNSVTQVEGSDVQQTTFGSFPNRAEAEVFALTLNKLNDGAATDLLNSGAGFAPGSTNDMTYAFQWDLTIAQGSSKVIGADMRLDVTPVPEPTTAALGLLGLTALLHTLRRRRV